MLRESQALSIPSQIPALLLGEILLFEHPQTEVKWAPNPAVPQQEEGWIPAREPGNIFLF